MLRRRALLVAGAALGVGPAFAHGDHRKTGPATVAAELARYRQLVAAGEAALAQGRAAEAAEYFEQAGGICHEAECELGLTRAWMQQGQYRRALAFVAHAAGVHRDHPAGSALYAWLLHVGGQSAFAERVMADALKLSPGDAALRACAQHMASQDPLPPLLMAPPVRLAPLPVVRGGDAPTASARVVSAGLWLGRGRALVPSVAIAQHSASVWVRNGVGESFQATLERRDDASGLALLSWAVPPTAIETQPTWATRDAFPGSAAFAFEQAAGPACVEPAWPLLRLGFLGRFIEGRGMALGIDGVGSGPLGAPVFDAQGRVVGLGVRHAGHAGQATLVPASVLRGFVGVDAGTVPTAPAARLPQDELYECGWALTVQVLVSS